MTRETNKVMICKELQLWTRLLNHLQMSGLPAIGRIHTIHQYVGEKDNKFGEIHNLNLVEACHSKIFALILIVIY